VWSKAVFVAAMSAVTTVSGVAMEPLFADPEAVALLTAALREAQLVAEADGITFAEDPVAEALAIRACHAGAQRDRRCRVILCAVAPSKPMR
jgi:ketopantoate reductase